MGHPAQNTNIIEQRQGWESEVTVSVGPAGSTILTVFVNGENIGASPTILGVEEPRYARAEREGVALLVNGTILLRFRIKWYSSLCFEQGAYRW